jgi:hypothetical protein
MIAIAVAGVLCAVGTAAAQTSYGRLNGVVRDASSGTPQMGATILLTPEAVGERTPTHLFTDENGAFRLLGVRPGLYSARVSLTGFLPAVQEHIRVSPNVTTVVRIELSSVFSSLEALRRAPARPSEGDDWRWVLRTSSSTRPVLHLAEATVTVAAGEASREEGAASRPRARIEMTSGAHHPGSSSGLSGPPATAASYDQSLGGAGRLLVAGRMSYAPEAGAGATFASVWLPGGEVGQGPETVVVLRQARFEPTGQSFRSLRAAHSEKMLLGDMEFDYGAAYVMAGVGSMTSSLRPRLRVSKQLQPGWSLSYSMETEPDSYGLRRRTAALESALEALDTLPVIIWKDGHSAIAGGWHHEFSVLRELGGRRSLEAVAFRDSSGHVAVFGFDVADASGPQEPPIAPYAHDGGASSSWGTRLVYREKISDRLEVAAIYAWAGVLAPEEDLASSLSDRLETFQRHSVAARVSGTMPGARTQFSASYKWLPGAAVSRQDVFGEAALGIDPNLSLTVRQPLPSFGPSGRWEALADFRNLLSQGNITVDTAEGRLLLTPVARSFRGGVSFQF